MGTKKGKVYYLPLQYFLNSCWNGTNEIYIIVEDVTDVIGFEDGS